MTLARSCGLLNDETPVEAIFLVLPGTKLKLNEGLQSSFWDAVRPLFAGEVEDRCKR